MQQKTKIAVIVLCVLGISALYRQCIQTFFPDHMERMTYNSLNEDMLYETLGETAGKQMRNLKHYYTGNNALTEDFDSLFRQQSVRMMDSIYSALSQRRFPGTETSLEIIYRDQDTLIAASVSAVKDMLQTRVIRSDLLPDCSIRGYLYFPKGLPYSSGWFKLLSILWIFVTPGFLMYVLYVILNQKKYLKNIRMYTHHIGHQLQSPLSVVRTSLLMLRQDNTPGEQDKYATLAANNLDKVGQLYNTLVLASEEDDHTVSVEKKEFDLLYEIENIAEEFRLKSAKHPRINIDSQLQTNIIAADRVHLCGAVYNLIDNAIKYSGEQVRIDIRLFESDHYICISVKDNGIGIAPEHLRKVFKKFYRIRKKSKVKGFGLGLSYVKAVCKAHGGTVELHSEKGKGSEFSIMIPANDNTGT